MKRILLLILFFILPSVFSQSIKITGVVMDAETKERLVGVNIFTAKKNKGTQTDFDGTFILKVKKGDELFFSFLGYQTKKVKVNSFQELSILLNLNTQKLKEVVISAKKNINDIDLRKVTSAITSVNITKIENRSSINAIETLQGQVSGVSVKTSGELGSPVKIRIRGTSTLPVKTKGGLAQEDKELLDNKYNQPLFVLDGQIISSEAFSMLNTNDIQQIKVLKDASASALYGVKAANGVVEITTKRGKNGKTEYSFSLQQGITFKGKPAQQMMDTQEKLSFERLSKNEFTPGYVYSEAYIRKSNKDDDSIGQLVALGQKKLDSISKINTNWFDELARISTYDSYNLSVRGGSQTNKFFISGNFSKQGGKFKGNDIKRSTGKLNYEFLLAKNIYVMLNSGFGFSEHNTPNSSDFSPSELIYVLNPYEQKKRGNLISYPNRTFKDLVNQYSKSTDESNFNFSANVNAELFKNLDIASVVGIQYGIDQALAIVPSTAYSERNELVSQRGKAVKRKTVVSNVTTNTRINYHQSFQKHFFSLSSNIDYYKNDFDLIGISGYGLPSKLHSGAGINNDITGVRKSKTTSKKTTDATLGFGFSGLYAWNELFNIYASYKRDASSLLPKAKRWHTFYALGVAFTLNDKNSFLKNNDWLSSIGFRGSYGKTASLSGITSSLIVPTFGYGELNYLGKREFSLKDLFNKGLRPEQNTSINLGVDFNLLTSLKISLDAYHRRTSDMLLTVPIAPSNGFNQLLKNIGVMDNRGVEVSISMQPVKSDTFLWNTSFNLAYNENKVIDLYGGTTLNLSGNPYPDYQEGKSANILYGLRSLGINPADGKPYFLRANGTRFNGDLEKPNPDDFVVLGKTTPPLNGGWYHSFSYHNFQLSFDVYYSFGGVAKYTNTARAIDDSDANKNLPKNKLSQTWFKVGDEGKKYPSIFIHGKEYWSTIQYASTDFFGKTDFIRLNNIMLKYNCHQKYLNQVFKGRVKNANCFFQLKNVGYWSNFKGGDPESANIKGSVQPIFTVGLNVLF